LVGCCRAWWWFLLAGLAGVVVGILTFAFPGLTAIMLVYFIAARALIIGIVEIAAGVALRKEVSSEWFLILKGILSVLFGLVLFVAPGAGALAMVLLMIGAYAIIAGVLLLLVAFRLRSWGKSTLSARSRAFAVAMEQHPEHATTGAIVGLSDALSKEIGYSSMRTLLFYVKAVSI
jgi:uncharacterized membrane protein HdeD (DUF308 family)